MNAKVLRLRSRANDEAAASAVTPDSPPALCTDVETAAYLTVHGFNGGSASLAPRAAMNPNTLALKVNPNVPGHKLSLEESVRVQMGANDYQILYAMAAALNHVALPVATDATGDVAERLAAIGAEVGDVYRATSQALNDQRITANERKRLRKEVAEAIAALNSLLSAL